MRTRELSKYILICGLTLAIPFLAYLMIVQPQTDKVFVERYSIETHTDNLNRTKRYVKFVQPKTKLIETLPYYGLPGDGQWTNGTLVIHRTKTYPTYNSEVSHEKHNSKIEGN